MSNYVSEELRRLVANRDVCLIESLTSIGEATARILKFNENERVLERETLIAIGRYPSKPASVRMRNWHMICFNRQRQTLLGSDFEAESNRLVNTLDRHLLGLALAYAPRYRRTLGYPNTVFISIECYVESHSYLPKPAPCSLELGSSHFDIRRSASSSLRTLP